MRVEFADESLARICTDEAHKLGLPFAVIKSARQKLLLLEAASDERDLRNWKSLNFKKLSGSRDDLRSVRINDQYRILFRISTDVRPPLILVTEIGDTH